MKFALFAQILSLPILVGLVSFSFVSGCAGPNRYPDLHPDKSVLVRQWTIQTRKTWEAGQRGTEYSNAAKYDNTLIFGNSSLGAVSIYPGINQVRWVFPVENGVHSPILVSGEKVYFVAGDGHLYAVDANIGEVRWKYNLRTTIASRPTVENGKLYITTSEDTVYCFDASTGEWIWHFKRRRTQGATIHGASSPLVVGNEVVVGLSDGFLVSLTTSEGKLSWEKKLHDGSKFTDVNADPVLVDGIFYVPSYDGAFYAIRRQDRQVLWKFDVGGSHRVLLDEGRIILPGSDGTVYALDMKSGKVLWKFRLDGGVPTEVVKADNLLVFGSSFQYFYALDRVGGRPLYRYNVGNKSGFHGSPLFDEKSKSLYILSGAGNLFKFTLREPIKKMWLGQTDPYEN